MRAPLCLLCSALLLGCAGAPTEPPGTQTPDGGEPRSGLDSGVPPTHDSGVLPTRDSGIEPTRDSGVEPSKDSGVEPAKDAGTADAGPPPCPAGLGDHWRCSGSTRVRCVDAVLQAEPCANGCAPQAGVSEAVCGCGAQSNFTRFNCLADGDLHTCKLGGWASESCGGRGCEAMPLGQSDVCKNPVGPLQTMLTKLGGLCGVHAPGANCGLAVKDLTTGETASYRGTVAYESASTVKAIWVALALYDVGPGPIQPYVNPVFANSDNSASGKVIDLLSAPDRINAFMWHDVHMPDSGFCRWNTDGITRLSSVCDTSAAGGYNYLAANDAVRFLSALYGKALIGAAKTQTLLQWMTLSPRTGYGGWFGTQLPAAARATMFHKAGWVPPGTSHEIGIVEIPGGHTYAAALLFDRSDGSTTAYNTQQLKTLEYASCVIYHAVAKDVADPFAACQAP